MQSRIFILCFSFFLLIAEAFGDQPIESDFQLQVVTESWYPFNYINEQEKIVGSSTDFVRRILDKADISYTINLYPWNRSYNIARHEDNVLIYSIIRSAIREKMFHWVCPLSNDVTHSIFKLSSRKNINMQTLDDLKHYSISVTRGSFPHEYFINKGHAVKQKIQLISTNERSLKMLLQGQVDLIVEVEETLYEMLTAEDIREEAIEVVHTFAEQGENCLALSKGTPLPLVEKIRQAHRSLLNQ
jgi:polar amino acid transport system substrate-binding protein